MSACDPVLLSALVDGELSPPEASAVRAHVAACATCRDRLEAFLALPSLVQESVPVPPEEAWEAFDAELARALPREGLVVRLRPLAAAAAAALVAVGLSSSVLVAVEEVSLAFTPRVLPELAFQDPVVRPRPAREGAPVSVRGLNQRQSAALARDGVVQVPGDDADLAAFYARERGARTLITADAALLVYGGAVQRAALEVEREHVAPGLRAVLGAMDRELARWDEQRAADPAALRLARGVVGVAARLAGDPVERSRAIEHDVALARAARGRSTSSVLGRGVDWAAFVPRGLLAATPDHARAVAWLSAASLRVDPDHPDETRAALLMLMALARGSLEDGSSALVAWNDVEDAAAFVHGSPDDLGTLAMLGVARSALGTHAGPAALDDPRLLRATWERAARAARVDATGKVATTEGTAVRARLLGGTRSLEGIVLSSLLDPFVPGRDRPTSLDLLGAIGSATARTIVSSEGFAGYDRALAALDEPLACVTTVPRAIARAGSGLERQRLFALAKLVERPARDAPAAQRSAGYEDRLLLAALAGLNAPDPAPLDEPGPAPPAVPAVEPLPAFYARLAYGARRLAIGLGATSAPRAPSIARATTRLHEVSGLLDGLASAARASLEGRAPSEEALRSFVRAVRTFTPRSAWSAEDVHVLVRGDGSRSVTVRTAGPIDALYLVLPGPSGDLEPAVGPALAARELVAPGEVRWDSGRAAAAPREDPAWAGHVVR